MKYKSIDWRFCFALFSTLIEKCYLTYKPAFLSEKAIAFMHKTKILEYLKKQWIILNSIRTLLGVVIFCCLFSGCTYYAPKKPKVVATFRGGAIVDKKILNEKIIESDIKLSETKWNEDGSLSLFMTKNRMKNYDLENVYEKGTIVRTVAIGENREGFDQEGVMIVLVNLFIAPAVATWEVFEDFANVIGRSIKEKKAIKQVKSNNESKPSFEIEGAHAFPFYSYRHVYTYHHESAGKEKTLLKNQNEQARISAAAVPIKATSPVFPSMQYAAEGDNNGVAKLIFAETPAKAMALKPTKLSITAVFQGKEANLGFVELGEEQLALIRTKTIQKSMTDKPVLKFTPYAKPTVVYPEHPVVAGGEFEIKISVTNIGKGAVSSLVATSESSVSEFNGIPFEFGMLNPNEGFQLSKKLKIPVKLGTGPVKITLNWKEGNDYAPDPIAGSVFIRGLTQPKFAMQIQVVDDGSGNSAGNHDGMIQKGEAIDFLVTVKNIGDGLAKKASVKLSGVEGDGVTVGVGEAQMGDIKPGESQTCRLNISMRKSAPVAELKPIFLVSETALDIRYEQCLALKINEALPQSIMTFNSVVYITGEDDVSVRNRAGTSSSIIGKVKPGTVLNASGEQDSFIRVELSDKSVGWIPSSRITYERPKDIEFKPGGIVEILKKAPPLIVLARYSDNQIVNVPRLELTGTIATSTKLRRVEYKLNGKVLNSEDSRAVKIVANMEREFPFVFSIDLAKGRNKVEISAWDDEDACTTKTLDITYEKPRGEVFLVCVGINKYSRVPMLKYAVEDAKSVASVFKQRLGVPDKNVILLLDEQATLTNLKLEMGDKLPKRATKDDTVIIYFAGHGVPEASDAGDNADGVSKFLLPVEGETTSLFSSALPMDDVCQIFRRLKSERVLFIADACYSGAAGGRTLAVAGTQLRSINQDDLLERLRKTGTGRVILTASRGSEVSQEKESIGHGVFTYYLVQGIEGKADSNKDGVVTITEVYQYLSKEVPKATGNTQHPLMKLDEMVGDMALGILK